MLKKLLSFTLLIVLAFSVMTGCNEQSPKDKLEESIKKFSDAKSLTEEIDITLKLNIPKEEMDKNPMMAVLVESINKAKVNGKFNVNQENTMVSGNIKVTMDGLGYDMQLYYSPQKYIIKVPMQEKYIVVYENEEEIHKNEAIALGKQLNKEFLEIIKDNNIKELIKEKITINNREVTAIPLSVSFTDEELKNIINELIPKLLENEMFSKYAKENMKKSNEIRGIKQTDKEIEDEIKSNKETIEKSLEEAFKIIDINKMNVKYYLLDKIIVGSDMIISVNVKEDVKIQRPEISMEIDMKTKFYNINEKLDVTMPETTQENSIRLEDLSKGLR